MTDAAKAEPQASPEERTSLSTLAPQDRFEPNRVPVRGTLWAAAGLFGGIAVAALVAWGMLALAARLDPPSSAPPLEAQRLEPPAPRLETTLLGEGPLVRAGAAQRIARYRWLDAAHARAEVPVERAMAILAERGWPDKEEAAR
ncbi:MAG: hypothetical protein INR68_15065 [Methylobacterium mesophilicum]|nr:hypothetical protein [Methylobacterium mesophilicum]